MSRGAPHVQGCSPAARVTFKSPFPWLQVPLSPSSVPPALRADLITSAKRFVEHFAPPRPRPALILMGLGSAADTEHTSDLCSCSSQHTLLPLWRRWGARRRMAAAPGRSRPATSAKPSSSWRPWGREYSSVPGRASPVLPPDPWFWPLSQGPFLAALPKEPQCPQLPLPSLQPL